MFNRRFFTRFYFDSQYFNGPANSLYVSFTVGERVIVSPYELRTATPEAEHRSTVAEPSSRVFYTTDEPEREVDA